MAVISRVEPEQDFERIVRDHYPEITGIHPAATIFPLMAPDEMKSLVENVKARGLANDIVLTSAGELLDGRNRVLACYLTGQEVRFRRVDPVDPIAWSLAQNLERRHLSASQRAMVADRVRDLYDALAKARQVANNAINAKPKEAVVVKLPERLGSISLRPTAPPAREQTGATAGVSGKYVDMARDVRRFAAPETVKQVERGALSLPKAHQQIAAIAKTTKAQTAPPPRAPNMQPVITPDGETKMVAAAEKPTFNQTNGNVEWASWTWNPVTGCLHGCNFCYARAITGNDQMKANYPFDFEPAFYRHRLAAPVNTKKPVSDNPPDGRVFVGSMADLFGKWVPNEWITEVFKACMAAPEWEYLFLTKWPKRYSMLSRLPHAWFGASVIQQTDVKRIEANMTAFTTSGVKWVSLEPMLGPIRFNDLSWCDLMVLGGQTGTRQPTGWVPEKAPEFDWIVDVVNQCREAGVPYYLKPNLATQPGMVLPKHSPRVRGGSIAKK